MVDSSAGDSEVFTHSRDEGLSAEDARYFLMFEHAPDMLLLVDEDDTVLGANRAACQVLSIPAHKLHGRKLWSLLDGGRPAVEELGGAERELKLCNGITVTVTAAYLPGKAHERLVSLRDVSAKLQLTERLAQAERLAAVGKLAAGVAHEINNPLAVLQLGLDALLARGLRSPDAEERLTQFAEHAKRIAQIVESLNQFASPRAPERDIVSVRALIERACTLSSEALTHADVRIEIESADLAVYADRAQMEQAVCNLLSNAGRATGGGQVLIRARERDGMCQLRVSDDGPGISSELAGEVFSPFAAGPGRGSLGLGLSVAWGLVQENGGTLRVSNRSGRGAHFEIVLPLPPARLQRSTSPSELPVAAGLRVLCVEDEPALRALLVAMLQDIGHIAIAAESAETALHVLAHEPIDVVLTDIQLPGQSGQVLEEAIRRSYPALAERVILMSGMFHDTRPGQRWLQKPFTFDALTRALEGL